MFVEVLPLEECLFQDFKLEMQLSRKNVSTHTPEIKTL